MVGTEERIPIPLMDYILNVVSVDSWTVQYGSDHIVRYSPCEAELASFQSVTDL